MMTWRNIECIYRNYTGIFLYFTLFFLISLFTSYPSVSFGGSGSDCNSNDVERIISGCSAIIDDGSLPGSTLAIAYSRRSDAYIAQSAYDEAIADREQAHELDPDNEGYERRLLEAYELRGDTKLAAEEFEAAVEDYSVVIDGGLVSAELLQKRSEAHLGAGDIANAITDMENTLELATEQTALIERIAILHELNAATAREAGNLRRAIESYEESLERLDSLGAACDVTGNAPSDGEDRICESKHRVKITLVATLVASAQADLQAGNEASAIASLQSASRHDTKNVEVQILLGVSKEKNGDFEGARHMFEQVLGIDPDNTEAKDGLDRLDERSKNLARTLQIELKRVGCDPGPIDGAWGPKSRAALDRFAQHSEENVGGLEPAQSVLETVARFDKRVCPTVSPPARNLNAQLVCKGTTSKYPQGYTLSQNRVCCVEFHQRECSRQPGFCIRKNVEHNCNNVNLCWCT